MNALIVFALLFIAAGENHSQAVLESDIEIAYQSAKKGIYWALSNIPEKRARLENDLIDNNRLVAKVKLSKQVNGIKIESTGYHLTNELTIKIYKSNDSLEKEGYLKKKEPSENR